MPEISNNKGNKIGFEVELPNIKVTRKGAGGAIENGCKLMKIKGEDDPPLFLLETEGANVSQGGNIVESYVEAISRPLRTTEEIVDFFRMVNMLVNGKYDNRDDAKTILQNLYVGKNPQICIEGGSYCLKNGADKKTIQVNISMCLSAVHFSKKLLELIPLLAKTYLESARKHTEILCAKINTTNEKNSIKPNNYVKSFLTLVFYQFEIYRTKSIKDVYYHVDNTRKYSGESGKLGSKECTVKQEFPMLFKVGLVDILTKVFNQNSIKILKELMCVTDNHNGKVRQRNLILEELNNIIGSCSSRSIKAGEEFVKMLQYNLKNLEEGAEFAKYWHNEPRYEALIEPYIDDELYYIVAEFRSQGAEGLLSKKIRELDDIIKNQKNTDIGEKIDELVKELNELFGEKYL